MPVHSSSQGLIYAPQGGKDKPQPGIAQNRSSRQVRASSQCKIPSEESWVQKAGKANVSLRFRLFRVIQVICVLLCLRATTLAQQDPTTADEVFTRYMAAIGADHFSSVTTVVERGEVSGNIKDFLRGSRYVGQSNFREHGTFESYYKSPNLRFGFTLTDKRQIIAVHGCDGKISWFIDSNLKRTEFTPKPDNNYECEEGFKTGLWKLNETRVRKRLVGRKEISGRAACEVKFQFPNIPGDETYYFDAETFLPLRMQKNDLRITYSDYRDVNGIKFPFSYVQELTNSKLVTTLREITINAPIDDARFVEAEPKNGSVQLSSTSPVKDDSKRSGPPEPSASTPTDETTADAPASTPPPSAPAIVEVNYPNFTSSPLSELQTIIPELKGLKAATDQEKLREVLDKVGAKIMEVARRMPNLISHEAVTKLQPGKPETRRDYDYLIVARTEANAVNLDEFRLDLRSGEKFETEEIMKQNPALEDDLRQASHELAASESGGAPISQGFATSWVHFYPRNQTRSTFRYLGEQRMDGRRTLVVAFAQKPESVPSPGMFRYKGKMVPVYVQGLRGSILKTFESQDFQGHCEKKSEIQAAQIPVSGTAAADLFSSADPQTTSPTGTQIGADSRSRRSHSQPATTWRCPPVVRLPTFLWALRRKDSRSPSP